MTNTRKQRFRFIFRCLVFHVRVVGKMNVCALVFVRPSQCIIRYLIVMYSIKISIRISFATNEIKCQRWNRASLNIEIHQNNKPLTVKVNELIKFDGRWVGKFNKCQMKNWWWLWFLEVVTLEEKKLKKWNRKSHHDKWIEMKSQRTKIQQKKEITR